MARPWLNEPSLALPIVIGVGIWATFGLGTMIFLAALSNLDQEQIDAARVDGASPLQIQRHVLFWQLLPVIEFWAILILINAVLPGAIDTAMVRSFVDSQPDRQAALDAMAAISPMNRLGRPEEIAESVLFLASERASFVTGASLAVDGGLLARM